MESIRKQEHNYLLFSALIVTLLINAPFLPGLFIDYGKQNFENFDKIVWIKRTIWYLIQCYVSIVIISYFNYFWKSRIIPSAWKNKWKILLNIGYNLLLAYLLLQLTVVIAGFTVGNIFGRDNAFIFYFWKYVYYAPIAIFLAYVLHLITKRKIIEIENAKLREENMVSQLNSLKEQINPHFLFNTLNTLSSVIRLEPRDSGLNFVDKLSSVYRYILESNNTDMVRLSTELEFIDSYLFMLKKRFEGKLEIEIDIPDEVKKSFIPPMTLQLLIENAIKHNKLLKKQPLQIRVFVQEKRMIIENNLHEYDATINSLGLGLNNLRERYRLIVQKEIIIRKEENSFIVELPIVNSWKS